MSPDCSCEQRWQIGSCGGADADSGGTAADAAGLPGIAMDAALSFEEGEAPLREGVRAGSFLLSM